MSIKASKILIIGLGLIGGSVAKALRMSGCTFIDGLDTDENTLNAAIEDGVINSVFIPKPNHYDIAICSLPHKSVPPAYSQIKESLKPGGVFAELSGLKTHVAHYLCDEMNERHVLLSLHPMAGSEKTGYSNSDSNLLSNAPIILTPTERTNDTALFWADFIMRSLNCSEMITLSAKKHDEIVALVSHLPHVVALSLWQIGKQSARCAGGSFHSATRVASLNSSLWAGLFTDNAEYLLKSIDEFKQNLNGLEQAIRKNNSGELEKLLNTMIKAD